MLQPSNRCARRVFLAISSLTAATALATTSVQDSRPQPGQEADPTASTFVMTHSTVSLAEELDALVNITATDVMMKTADSSLVRVVAVSGTIHKGNVMLGQVNAVESRSVESTQPVTIDLGPYNTGLADVLAFEVIGSADPSRTEALLRSGRAIAMHRLDIRPSHGLTWGEVVLESELELTVEPVTD